MQATEWTHIVAKLNANYPGQQVDAATAAEWFGPLSGYPVTEVWAAVARHRQTITPGRDGLPVGRWRPELTDLLAAIDANWREDAAARRELEAQQARAERNGRGGVRMPPETRDAIAILKASKLPPDHLDHVPGPVAKQRIEALAEQLAERVDRAKRGVFT